MPTFRRLVAVGCATTVLGVVGGVVAPAVAAPDAGLPGKARSQIEALAAAKLLRSAADRKLDSPLLTASQLRRGRALPAGVDVRATVPTDASGRTTVDIHGAVDDALLTRVRALGGTVRSTSYPAGVVRAELPIDAVEPLAAQPQVTRLRSFSATALTGRVDASARAPLPGRSATSKTERSQVTPLVGPVTSEGDTTHGVGEARARLGVSGIGVTVGVLSDGVDALATSIAAGELPPDVTVLPGAAGSGDEGTAMLEIVHDLAPKARLLFATAFDGAASFADNIRALRAAGADVIVDDVLYLGESPFQDGPVAQAVIDVTRSGALYVSSAGNEGNVDDGTSGNYEGPFRSSGVGIGKYAGTAHDFDPGAGVQAADPVTASSVDVPALLQWANPLGRATDDYDLYALDADGDVVGFSNSTQDGDDDPFEGFLLPSGTDRLAVLKFSGADRYFQLSALRGRFGGSGTLTPFATPGATRGHSAVPAALSVAAAPAAGALPFDLEPGDPANPTGPFPGVYTAAQLSERFTSDGPRRVFFSPDGAPLEGAGAGRMRAKPDVTAADGVRTSVAGFQPFFGTSAAAPHAAAMAALALSGRPGINPGRVRAALRSTALDIEQPGRDRDTGAGILQAGPLLAAVGAAAQPYAQAGGPVVTGSTDGDLFLEPGESGAVSVPVTNTGDAPATGVSVSLTTALEGVTVTPSTQPYADVPAGAVESGAFTVTVAPTVRLGTTVPLSSRVRFAGGFSPRTTSATLVVGQPSDTVVTSAYSGPPVPIADLDPAGTTVTLPVTGVGPVSGVTFSVDGTDCVAADTAGLSHTYVGDLVGTLTAPDGTQVPLFDRIGGAGDNLCQAVFTDAAPRPIESATSSDAPYTGSWLPSSPLSTLLGRNGDGAWLFTVVDAARGDVGELRAVSLNVSGYVAPPA
ncbi:MAG TPA: S8 family serine peptidase [Mycobacteriales bacterium]|jgi:subtilisin-like proprotein convertase family protein|nr:S8 family serine peptidase [Mycobacteriales bacterium]